MARYMRTDLGKGHTRLSPPAAVGEGIVFPPIYGTLSPTSDAQIATLRRRGKSTLRPPRVVTPAAVVLARPTKVTLAPSTRLPRAAHSKLRPPTVIDLSPQVNYVGVNLAYSRRGQPKSRLFSPAVVAPPFVASPVSVTLTQRPEQTIFARCFTGATSERKLVRTNLVPNGGFESGTSGWVTVGSTTFIGSSPGLFGNSCGRMVTDGLGPNEGAYAEFVADGRPVTVSVYLQRTGAGSAVQLAVTDSLGGNGQQGASFTPGLEWARYSFTTTPLSSGVWRFYIQTAGASALVLLVDGAQAESGTIATPYIETDGSPASSQRSDIFGYERCVGPRLPRVLEQFFERNRPDVTLAYSRRGRPVYRLRPPTAVAEPERFFGPSTTFAYQSRGKPRSRLFPPVVIDLTPQTTYLSASLAYSVRGVPKSRLFAPAVIQYPAPFVAAPVTVSLAYSLRGTPKPRLFAPVVVGEGVVFPPIYGSLTPLTYANRPVAKSRLFPPTVVTTEAVVVYFGPQITLAPGAARPASWLLRPPVVVGEAAVFYARPVMVRLARSSRLRAKWGLAAPAVVFIAEPVLHPVAVTLAYSRRGKPKSLLRRPLVVGAVVYYGPQTSLAYSRRGAPKSVLRKPVVIDVSPQTRYLNVNLTYSLRGRPVSQLRPPAVIRRDVFAGPAVSLAYSRRGTPQSSLEPPTVIDLRPQVFYLSVTLARIKPPPTFTRLSPSVVTEALPKAERDLRVTLAYSRRGQPKSELRPPAAVDLRPQTRFLSVNLAYSRRGKPVHLFIGQPKVVRVETFAGPTVTLIRIRPVPTDPKLRPPTVVFPFFARATEVTLARIRPPKRFWRLSPPTVVGGAVLYPISVTLAPGRAGEAKYGLAPPAVVSIPEPVLHPIVVALVRITPPERFWRLFPPAVVRTFIPPAGDVCGTDEPASDVCGSDSAESRIVGSDSAVGDVCGTDQQST